MLEILSISPNGGHTGGQTYVELTGSNFRLPTPQPLNPATGKVPAPPASFRVLFGGIAAVMVAVVSPYLAFCKTPVSDPSEGPVDVVVQNLADDGTVLEEATLPACWRFIRPELTSTGESDVARIIRSLIQDLKRQITPNVYWPSSSDYDEHTEDLLNEVEIPAFPAIVFANISFEENPVYKTSEPIEVPDPEDPDGFVMYAPPEMVDIVIPIIGSSDNSAELINLSNAVRRFFRKTIHVKMLRDPDAVPGEMLQWDLGWDPTPTSMQIAASSSNVKTFSGTARIIGFPIEQLYGLPRGGPGTPDGEHESVVATGKTMETLQLEPPAKKSVSSG